MAEERLRLKIEGMTCDGCADTIRRYLKRENGVKEATIDWRAGTGIVTYDPELTSRDKILANKVFTTHYRAEVVDGAP
ncbi:MAG: heavy-metal-associated domain-containing protein [Dehalococcoidia bacterium]